MSNHRKSNKGDGCTTATITLCNGALKVVRALQAKHLENTGCYLATPRAINLLLTSIKMEK